MRFEDAERIVENLRQRRVFAHVLRNGISTAGVRVVIGDGREALWDADQAAGLEAQILLDGILVGYVPLVEGSKDFTWEQAAEVIYMTDYGSQ